MFEVINLIKIVGSDLLRMEYKRRILENISQKNNGILRWLERLVSYEVRGTVGARVT